MKIKLYIKDPDLCELAHESIDDQGGTCDDHDKLAAWFNTHGRDYGCTTRSSEEFDLEIDLDTHEYRFI